MSQNILQLLNMAIKQKQCVAIRYRDQHQIRVLEPHAIYADENGETVVDCYQVRGYSASGRPAPFWRPFRLKKITAISLLQETFAPRVADGFSPTKLKYRKGLIAMVSATDLPFVYPFQATAPEDVGPQLPRNPYRR